MATKMDFLKAAIDKKRKLQTGGASGASSASSTSNQSGRPTKRYRTRKEIEEEEEATRQAEIDAKRAIELEQQQKDKEREQELQKALPVEQKKKDESATSSTTTSSGSSNSLNEDATIAVEDVIRRLRELKQPVTLFGETAGQREKRLKIIELQDAADSEYKSGSKDTFGADLKRLMKGEDGDNNDDADSTKKREEKAKFWREMPPAIDGGEADDLMLNALPKAEFCLTILSRLMHEWERELDERSDAAKRASQGQIATATFKQTTRNIRPLRKHLRRKTLPGDILNPLHEIVQLMRKREYVQANKAYLTLAIGNAPWPMGVTMVGIHERSAREKIFSNQVAHVLNDETQRKYIQAVKRLMSFAQAKYVADPSKSIG